MQPHYEDFSPSKVNIALKESFKDYKTSLQLMFWPKWSQSHFLNNDIDMSSNVLKTPYFYTTLLKIILDNFPLFAGLLSITFSVIYEDTHLCKVFLFIQPLGIFVTNPTDGNVSTPYQSFTFIVISPPSIQ